MSGKIALIAGASGLIGSELVRYLVEAKEYEKVVAIVRSPLSFQHPRLVEVIADFDQLEQHKEAFAVHDVFCCLGTTIKKAKSQEAMYKIDVTYPLEIARLSHQMGAKHFLLVSALGANSKSKVFYSRIKGILENELASIPFSSISILQPSLLLGDRKEFRLGERAAAVVSTTLSFLFIGPLRQYKAIKAKDVALAMFKVAQLHKQGVHIYPSVKIASIARD